MSRPNSWTWRYVPTGEARQYTNAPKGIASIMDQIVPLEPAGVVLEATGGFEMLVAGELELAGLPVSLVNPRQVRSFARATGRLAKTDAIDAQVLAQFAEAVKPPVRPLPDADTQEAACPGRPAPAAIRDGYIGTESPGTCLQTRMPPHRRAHSLAQTTGRGSGQGHS